MFLPILLLIASLILGTTTSAHAANRRSESCCEKVLLWLMGNPPADGATSDDDEDNDAGDVGHAPTGMVHRRRAATAPAVLTHDISPSERASGLFMAYYILGLRAGVPFPEVKERYDALMGHSCIIFIDCMGGQNPKSAFTTAFSIIQRNESTLGHDEVRELLAEHSHLPLSRG